MDYILKMILKIKIKYINIGYLLKLFKKVEFCIPYNINVKKFSNDLIYFKLNKGKKIELLNN